MSGNIVCKLKKDVYSTFKVFLVFGFAVLSLFLKDTLLRGGNAGEPGCGRRQGGNR